MNREIKFRGISQKTNEWVYGSYQYYTRRGSSHFIIDKDNNHILCYEETIGQLTGLNDKNGKEIYEGDILKVRSSVSKAITINHNGEMLTAYKPIYNNYFVVFYKSAFCIHDEPTTDNHEQSSLNNGTTFAGTLQNASYDREIIGNIYENPELINNTDTDEQKQD